MKKKIKLTDKEIIKQLNDVIKTQKEDIEYLKQKYEVRLHDVEYEQAMRKDVEEEYKDLIVKMVKRYFNGINNI